MLTNELIKKYQFFLNYNHSSIEEMEGVLHSNRRVVLSDIQKINDVLEQLSLPQILIENGEIQAPVISMNDLLRHVDIGGKEFIFQEERLEMLTLYLLLSPNYISNYHLQTFLKMSKNSILSALREVRRYLYAFDVTLQYSRAKGYFLVGSGNRLRELLESSVENLMTLTSGKWVMGYVLKSCHIDNEDEKLFATLRAFGERHQVSFIFENARRTAMVLAILNQREVTGTYHQNNLYYHGIRETSLFKVVQELENVYPQLVRERDFVLSRLAGCVQGDLNVNPESTVVDIMDEIIMQVKANTGLDFPIGTAFRKNLYAHLYPSYYRVVFNITLHNPLTQQIQKEYSSLYELIKRSLRPLEEITGKVLSEDEVAYFTMHFGGYLESESRNADERQLNALIVCPNGISTSLILESELKKLFPMIEFRAQSLSHLRQEEADIEEVDIIFSTTHIDTPHKVFIVKPLMTSLEKMLLKRQVFEYLHLEKENIVSVDELLAIINRHATIKNVESLRQELTQYLFAQPSEQVLGGDSLTTLLKEEFIQQVDRVENWQSAVRVAAEPLLKNGYIEESYIDAIIASVNELGPYIVLAPKVAVPHASPEAGVRKLGISLLQLKDEVDFSDNGDEDKKVQLVFVLAAVDSTAHLTALQELAMILEDDDVIDELIEASNPHEILTIIDRVVQEGEE